MDWLTYYGKSYIRFSDADNLFQLLHIEIADNLVSVRVKNKNVDIDLSDIKAVWVWHGNFRFKDLSMKDIDGISANFEVASNLWSQMKVVYGFIEEYINSKCIIGCPNMQDVNKLTLLRYAKEVGLLIPHTLISTEKSQVHEFNRNRELITKSLHASPFIHDRMKKTILEGYTTAINPGDLENVNSEYIFPSLVQEKLDKKYELRIFYLDRKCYPMAIFSQRDKQTEIDFRRYNKAKPNRMMKCSIPAELAERIVQLMDRIGLNTGSLDFVKTKDNKYVFLEVNPVGQFGFVSDNCNYNLEKIIAEKLVSFC
jgi:ATP-GRASP peptide maturase of grasp-with-spasm system